MQELVRSPQRQNDFKYQVMVFDIRGLIVVTLSLGRPGGTDTKIFSDISAQHHFTKLAQ